MSSIFYIFILNHSSKTCNNIFLISRQEGDNHGVRDLWIAGGGGGAGPEAGHLSPTAPDGHGEVVEGDQLTLDDVVLVPMGNTGHKSNRAIVCGWCSPCEC